MIRTIKLKHTMVIAVLAVALTTPAVVRAYSNDELPIDDVELTSTTSTVQAPLIVNTPVTETVVEPAVETTTETPVVEVPPVDVIETDETPVEEEPVTTEVTINDAIVIAQAEHPDVEVVLAKVKLAKLGEDKVYKIAFADGWRIYVAADDGEILRIKDPTDKKHDCGERGQNAVNSWRKKYLERKNSERRENSERNNQNREWKHRSHRN